MAQVAADTLGMPIDLVRVFHGSTPYLNEGYGAFASRSTVLGGSAVYEGAKSLLEKIRGAAAARLGCPLDDIELADGRDDTRDGRSLSFAELAADGRRVDATFRNNDQLPYTYGSAVAHVAVELR